MCRIGVAYNLPDEKAFSVNIHSLYGAGYYVIDEYHHGTRDFVCSDSEHILLEDGTTKNLQ